MDVQLTHSLTPTISELKTRDNSLSLSLFLSLLFVFKIVFACHKRQSLGDKIPNLLRAFFTWYELVVRLVLTCVYQVEIVVFS